MSSYKLFFLGLFTSLLCPAQSLLWAKSMGGMNSEFPYAIAIDGSGNVFTTGFFQNTCDFDPGPGTFTLAEAGSNDLFVSKLDANGNFVWAKRIGSFSLEEGRGIATDAAGNVYVTGRFWGTVDFDPGAGTNNLVSTSSYDAFILKLDPQGNFVWAKNLGGSSDDVGTSISIDASGDVYTTGQFNGTADFDPGAAVFNFTSAGNLDVFVSKLSSSGTFLWAKQVGGSLDDVPGTVDHDAQGNVYIGGFFKGTADFDPGTGTSNLTTPGGAHAFILKLTVSGNFVWAKSLGGNFDTYAMSLLADATGNVYTTGHFQGTADFDPGVGTYTISTFGYNDVYLSKLDAAGNFVWAGHMGGGGQDIYSNSLTQDGNGDVYVTGSFSGAVDLDPGPGTYSLNAGLNDEVFITKVTSSGSLLWAHKFGGNSNDYGRAIVADPAGNIYATGSFDGIANFDPGPGTFSLTAVGVGDIFVMKLSAGAVGIQEQIATQDLLIYPNPSKGVFNISMQQPVGKVEIVLVNAIGQQVYNRLLATGATQVDAGKLAQGLYHYSVLQNGRLLKSGTIAVEQ